MVQQTTINQTKSVLMLVGFHEYEYVYVYLYD